MARISVKGFVGGDPKLEYGKQSNTEYTRVSVAETKRYQKDGEWHDGKTTWYSGTVFGDTARLVAQRIKKGMQVIVEGEVEASAYLDNAGKPQPNISIGNATIAEVIRPPRDQNGAQNGNFQGAQNGGFQANQGGNFQGGQNGNFQGAQNGGFQANQGGDFQGNQGGDFPQGNQNGGFQGNQNGGFQGDQNGGFQGDQGGNFPQGNQAPQGGYQNQPVGAGAGNPPF